MRFLLPTLFIGLAFIGVGLSQSPLRLSPLLPLGQSAMGPFPTEASFAEQLNWAGLERTRHFVVYDPSYVALDYPGGDVSANRGVCTDVIIRIYRRLGIDLQREVHEDMRAHFSAYPKIWGLSGPDRNIDHRRVPNLETFFTRRGAKLPPSNDPKDYQPGDIVTWRVGGRTPHVGMVVDRRSADGRRPLIVHNMGRGPRVQDVLFAFPLHGHFRWHPADTAATAAS